METEIAAISTASLEYLSCRAIATTPLLNCSSTPSTSQERLLSLSQASLSIKPPPRPQLIDSHPQPAHYFSTTSKHNYNNSSQPLLIISTSFKMSDFTAQILPRSNVASVVTSATESRLYFQNNQGEVFESIYRKGQRLTTSSTGLKARLRTPLAAVSFDAASEVRVYYLSEDNKVKEWAFTANRGWYQGGLSTQQRAADGTQISAIYWQRDNGRELRVYFQEENTTNIREITHVLGQASAGNAEILKFPV
ncbi:hypothetical protein BJ508DRAFT_418524 [Ascobolus immersus RN42]|uniref:Uncharacterized protein n=1 Tax=Ascobolus immersus RN42 TaxID=1160509 RepID=A0A3N4HLA7_ASCIM|nr:hypothetical protein BJ508DRAFT_418524 [Ascobolus immersus RN42]